MSEVDTQKLRAELARERSAHTALKQIVRERLTALTDNEDGADSARILRDAETMLRNVGELSDELHEWKRSYDSSMNGLRASGEPLPGKSYLREVASADADQAMAALAQRQRRID